MTQPPTTPAIEAAYELFNSPQCDTCAKFEQRIQQAISAATEKLTKENEAFRRYLERAGWGPCNIPACNCPNWHKLRESADEREMFSQIQTLTARVRELESDLRFYKKPSTEDYD